MKFEVIKARIEDVLKSYECVEVLKYEETDKNNGAFLVQYKEDVVAKYTADTDTDAFTYDIWFNDQDVDLVDCNGYGFATANYETIKEVFDETFSNESVAYNLSAYYEEENKLTKVRLTTDEYNALQHITSATKTDCWFTLETDEDGYDYVFDLEEDYEVDLPEALAQLYEAVEFMTFDDWKALGVSEQEVGVFAQLLERLKVLS